MNKKILKKRFPDVPELGNIDIEFSRFSKFEEDVGGDSVAGLTFYPNNKKEPVTIFLNKDRMKRYSPEYKHTLTHEGVHVRRYKYGEECPDDDKEEAKTELETNIRKGIVDMKFAKFPGYYGHFDNPLLSANEDYKTLTGAKIIPKGYGSAKIPSTNNINDMIDRKSQKTNLWWALVTKRLKFDEDKGNELKSGRGRKQITGKSENIDTHYVTSEGDRAHVYSPRGKIKKKGVAKFIDRLDGIVGEEVVFEVLDNRRKNILIGKKTKKTKKSKKKRVSNPIYDVKIPNIKIF